MSALWCVRNWAITAMTAMTSAMPVNDNALAVPGAAKTNATMARNSATRMNRPAMTTSLIGTVVHP